jgi:Domain of unknown function (DUF4124)
MNYRLNLPTLLLLVCAPLTIQAQIYQSIDEDGNVSYTDKPPQGQKSEQVKLPPTNTAPPIKPRATTAPETDGEDEAEDKIPSKYSISISNPGNDAQIPTGQRDINVSLNLSPVLHKSHKVQLMVDGAPFGNSFSGTSGTLKEIYRGSHKISAAVVDQKGKTISVSDSITIHVQRHSRPRPAPAS